MDAKSARGWVARAACRTVQPDALFVPGAEQQRIVQTLCRGCPVRTECLAHALDGRIEHGVWGMTERDRRALLRRRSAVKSWRSLLEAARNAYGVGAAEEAVNAGP
ncbi:WhiB family transcriptional regulator [Streptomyces sp. NPDC005963]|uniref:WhiB family transcriptional regulator n=1 Tax=Streptomyces sp. NPDC005963 TaxID=3156721 RepID=UPI003402431D